MRVGSLFSGIGGLDLGLERAGMEVVWQVEIDPFRRRVLARHWPGVERHEDVRRVTGNADAVGYGADADISGDGSADTSRSRRRTTCSTHLAPVDLICGGFPCQDLSVAGRRAGLRAPRSGLFFEFARIVGEILPDWILVENVPGLLSSNGGDDFRVVVDALQGIGYGLSWRILDSRHFGVPQRRRRIYVVGSLGDLRSAAVLFEPEGGGGDTSQGPEAGEGTACATLQGSSTGRRGHRNDAEGAAGGHIIAIGHGQGDPNFQEDEAYALDRGQPQQAVCAPPLRAGKNRTGGDRPPGTDVDTAASLICAPSDPDGVREATGVPRRVDVRVYNPYRTLREDGIDEGFKEDDTHDALHGPTDNKQPLLLAAPLEAADGHHGRSNPRGDGADNLVAPPLILGDAPRPCCPDGPRYAALGDAVTVSVAEWIGRRIVMAEAAP